MEYEKISLNAFFFFFELINMKKENKQINNDMILRYNERNKNASSCFFKWVDPTWHFANQGSNHCSLSLRNLQITLFSVLSLLLVWLYWKRETEYFIEIKMSDYLAFNYDITDGTYFSFFIFEQINETIK